MPRGIEQRAGVHRLPARRVATQIVQKSGARTRPALADVIEFVGAHAGKIEAGANREGGKARVVLHAAEALFGDGEKHFAVARDARRGIVHLRIVDSDRNHIAKAPRVREELAHETPCYAARFCMGHFSESLKTIFAARRPEANEFLPR